MSIIEKILSPTAQQFLQDNQTQNPHRLLFKKVEGIDVKLMVQQIIGKQKSKNKLPLWFENEQVIYPAKLSMEQCSSQVTAAYKANLVEGNSVVDLTGGFGVDSYFLAQRFQKLDYVEQQTELFQIAQHNFKVLGQDNVSCHNTTTLDFVTSLQTTVDGFYIDPARRTDTDKKIFTLEESEPNILELAPILLQKGRWILLKASPMLDIHLAIRQLPQIQKVYVVAVQNECKELLFLLSNETIDSISIECINFQQNQAPQIFKHSVNDVTYINYSLPKKYIYDPNKSIIKAGLFNAVAEYFQLGKLHANSHLYTSKEYISDFPGRIFELKTILKPQKKELKRYLLSDKVNLATRNFPATVAALRKKWKLKDGGDIYLFATTLMSEQKVVLDVRKI